jgi:hypothetical protein
VAENHEVGIADHQFVVRDIDCAPGTGKIEAVAESDATTDPEKKMGVNMRMFESSVLAAAQVEKLDGASDL